MRFRVMLVALGLSLTSWITLLAQEKKEETKVQAAAWPAANPKDVESLDAILAAVYDVISGPAGDRDWNRFRSLFVPEGRLVPIRKNADGSFVHQVLSVDDYANRAGDFFKKEGFFEKEISHKTDRFGQLAVVFTTYGSWHTADMNEKPFARGINSIQLLNDGTRWWIVTVYWQAERPDTPLPPQYLKKPR